MLAERFHRQHEDQYGYRLDDAVVEFVHLNATAIQGQRQPPGHARAGPSADPIGARPVYFKEVRLGRDADLSVAATIGARSSTLDGPGDRSRRSDSTTIVLGAQIAPCAHARAVCSSSSSRGGRAARPRPLEAKERRMLDQVWLKILHSQLVNICEEMGSR